MTVHMGFEIYELLGLPFESKERQELARRLRAYGKALPSEKEHDFVPLEDLIRKI